MLQILIGTFIGTGVFFILAEFYKIPHMATSRSFANLSRRQRKQAGVLTVWIQDISGTIEGFCGSTNTNAVSFSQTCKQPDWTSRLKTTSPQR